MSRWPVKMRMMKLIASMLMKVELSTRIRKSLGWRCKSYQSEGILTSRTECEMP